MTGRVPGPIGMDRSNTPRIDSGTAARTQNQPPGGTGGVSGHGSQSFLHDTRELGWMDTADAAEAIWDALKASRSLVGPVVMEQTGLMIGHIMAGLLPGLMMAIGVMTGTTVLGAGVGALIGTLAGGIGAAPGAILGGQLGYNLGMAAMALLGLGFLAQGIIDGLPEFKLFAERGTKRAVNSLFVPVHRKRHEIHLAAQDYAMAQALLLKLVLMSLVALLLKKPTAASVKGLASSGRNAAGAIRSGETVAAAEAGVAEIVAQLRASKLGEGFAAWVEANWRELIENPKLKPQVRGASTSPRLSLAATPSQLVSRQPVQAPASARPETPKPAPPARAQEPDYGVAFFGKDNVGYYTKENATIGREGRSFFMMPLDDAAAVKNASDAARLTGMAPSARNAYLSGEDIYGLSFPTQGMRISQPMAADAMGWPHFLEGGHTAVLTGEGPGAAYLVNPTREFVIPGGATVPEGSVLFKLGANGEWLPMKRF